MDDTPELQEFTAQEARVRFREVLDSVRAGRPVALTRYGRPEAVVVSAEWYERALAALPASDPNE